MKESIRQRAVELGFDDCHFTSAAVPASADQFQRWLAQKNHGEMGWLERNAEKRVDPQKVLPGAKSVIVLATSLAAHRHARSGTWTPGLYWNAISPSELASALSASIRMSSASGLATGFF